MALNQSEKDRVVDLVLDKGCRWCGAHRVARPGENRTAPIGTTFTTFAVEEMGMVETSGKAVSDRVARFIAVTCMACHHAELFSAGLLAQS